MLMGAATAGLAAVGAVLLALRHASDPEHRLRLERLVLRPPQSSGVALWVHAQASKACPPAPSAHSSISPLPLLSGFSFSSQSFHQSLKARLDLAPGHSCLACELNSVQALRLHENAPCCASAWVHGQRRASAWLTAGQDVKSTAGRSDLVTVAAGRSELVQHVCSCLMLSLMNWIAPQQRG